MDREKENQEKIPFKLNLNVLNVKKTYNETLLSTQNLTLNLISIWI